MSALHTMRMYGRFMAGLPGFLRRHISVEEAAETIRRGLRERDDNFLRIARKGIYSDPTSPYLRMLELAGCEYGDLEHSVRDNGLEPTLERLRAEGVYVTFEEYKGREPIVRNGREIPSDHTSFDNPLAVGSYEGETGGSTGKATRVSTDLDNLYSHTAHIMMNDHVHGMIGWPKAVWKGTLPDPVGTGIFLRSSLYDEIPDRWFTPVTREHYTPPLRFRLATWYILLMSRLMGQACPWPEPLPLDRAEVIARWAAEQVPRHGGAHVVAGVSLAVRICLAAEEAGIDMTGVKLLGAGEPFTAAKKAAFDRVGATYIPIYISEDTGPMGMPCAHPTEPNEQHQLADNLALIQHPREVNGHVVDAFYFTTLRDKSAKLMLNMESDDFGIVEQRSCGCAWEELGYTRHLRRIRSFGKLTGEGVTLVGSEMIRVLEEVLPARFGGGPQDYQLVEEEDDRGLTRLTLRVRPGVTDAEDHRLANALLEGVKQGSVAGSLAGSYWEQGENIRVRREKPVWTARGKLPSLQIGDRR